MTGLENGGLALHLEVGDTEVLRPLPAGDRQGSPHMFAKVTSDVFTAVPLLFPVCRSRFNPPPLPSRPPPLPSSQ